MMVKQLEYDPAAKKVAVISENPRYLALKLIRLDSNIIIICMGRWGGKKYNKM